jgi:uncharacterized protein (TIGR01777 family)
MHTSPATTFVIAGGNGFLGRVLQRHWLAAGHRVIVLARNSSRGIEPGAVALPWDGRTAGEWGAALEGADVLINLTGRSVDCRYHARNRAAIFSSRLDSTRVLADAMAAAKNPPAVWLNAASATRYRHAEDRPQDEITGEVGHGFSVEVCEAWERAFFEPALPSRIRRVALRTGIVLGRDGGVFPVFRRLARAGLAGRIGHGRQMFSWLHEGDFCRAVDWLIAHPNLTGPVNLTAPGPVPMNHFTAALRRHLGVAFGLPLPRPILEIGAWFIRTETELLLKSRWVVPLRLLESGFTFTHATLDSALIQLTAKAHLSLNK